MQVDYIREKAKKLGLDPGTSSNHEDNLRTIAAQLGMDYDLLPSLNILDGTLDEMLIQRENELNNQNPVEQLMPDDELVDSSEESPSEQQNNDNNSTSKKNTDSKDDTEESGESPEEKDTSETSSDNQGREEKKKKNDSSEEGDTSSNGDDKPNQQKGKNTPKGENADKLPQTPKNKFQGKRDALNEKTNGLRNKFNNLRHPGEALKSKGKSAVKDGASKLGSKSAEIGKNAGKAVSTGAKKAGSAIAQGAKSAGSAVVKFIVANPEVAIIILALVLILFLIMFLFMAGGSQNDINIGYYDTTCDFNLTTVSYTDCESGTIQNLDLSDFVKGNVYTQIKDKEFNSDEIKAMMIISKTNALISGKYDNTTKNITIDGCNMEYQNYNESTIDFNSYYESIEGQLYLPSSISGTITNLQINTINFDVDSFKGDNSNYEEILNNQYSSLGYKIYDLKNNCTYYNVTENDAYWWPIGSEVETSSKIHAGTPSTINVSSKYGYRTVKGKTGFHHGIDISGGSCVPNTGTSKNVIIASKAGKVIESHNGCASLGTYGSNCGGGYGNYVILDHGDGTKTVYAHLMKDTIVVSNGENVEQGQKLGIMGSSGSSTGCHLHFEVRVNNSRVNPLNYVSTENPRPVSNLKINGVSNSSGNKNEVCQTLLNSGFSENATIGLMININAESGFDPNNVGDSGTSYGLCQWHNGRWSKLKRKKPNSWQTIKGQLEYLLYELENVDQYAISYKYIMGNYSAREISTKFCMNFEVPANKETVCPKRADDYLSSMTAYVKNGCKEGN